MTHIPITRRQFLATTGAVTATGLAGCAQLTGGQFSYMRLDPPENYEQMKEADLPHPIYGEELPDATVPSPTLDREMQVREFVGDRCTLLTFIYTRCEGICPAEMSNLVQVQASAAKLGKTDDIALLAMTFDPEYDTPERLQEFGENLGMKYDQDNFYYLRPETPERAKELVEDRYGDPFSANDGDGMAFLHRGLMLLVNEDGYVERAYAGKPPQPATVVADFEALMEA